MVSTNASYHEGEKIKTLFSKQVFSVPVLYLISDHQTDSKTRCESDREPQQSSHPLKK